MLVSAANCAMLIILALHCSMFSRAMGDRASGCAGFCRAVELQFASQCATLTSEKPCEEQFTCMWRVTSSDGGCTKDEDTSIQSISQLMPNRLGFPDILGELLEVSLWVGEVPMGLYLMTPSTGDPAVHEVKSHALAQDVVTTDELIAIMSVPKTLTPWVGNLAGMLGTSNVLERVFDGGKVFSLTIRIGRESLSDSASACSVQFSAWHSIWRELSSHSLHVPDSVDIFAFQAASARVLSCWGVKGRMWDLTFKSGDDIAFSSICAPDCCSRYQLEAEIVPHVSSQVTTTTGLSLPPLEFGSVVAQEVVHWEDLPLDFVIVGIDGCGSTSLRQNLGQHPEISFTNLSLHHIDEDWFLQEVGTRALPLKSHVEKFAAHQSDVLPNHTRKLLGLYQPLIWKEEKIHHLLSFTNVRIIFVVCDPVDRLLRRVYSDMQDKANSLAEILDSYNRGSLHRFLAFGESLLSWASSFFPRIHVVHVASLRDSPWDAFHSITDFLGVAAFPQDTHFPRYNAKGNYTSPVCKSRAYVNQLKHDFEPDYKAIEQVMKGLGAWVPTELLQRRTRCDRRSKGNVAKGPCIKTRCD